MESECPSFEHENIRDCRRLPTVSENEAAAETGRRGCGTETCIKITDELDGHRSEESGSCKGEEQRAKGLTAKYAKHTKDERNLVGRAPKRTETHQKAPKFKFLKLAPVGKSEPEDEPPTT
jgi:hypothetical protein